MVWEALHTDRDIAREALASGISEALGISTGDMSIADAIEKADQGARVLVAARSRPGEFSMTVDIITGDDAIADKLDNDSLRKMCATWGCRGLVDDGSDNPYRMILLNDGDDEAVYVEAEPFDEREEIIIAGPASTVPAPSIPDGPRSQRRPTPPPPPPRSNDDEE